MTKILGQSIATAEQMAAYLLEKNPNPQIILPPLEHCQTFLDVAAKEGARGDALFALSCKETGNYTFKGTVKPEQNNYGGMGTTDANTPGASFPDTATCVLAMAQHARGYATTAPLNLPCVDPRYEILKKYNKLGIAQHWEELGGKWAVPGYDTKLYASLKDANDAEDSYGYHVVNILNEILKMPKGQEVVDMDNVPIFAFGAGHGYNTAGKRCMKSLDPDQTREWFLNDRVMDIAEEDLTANYYCKVLRVGDTTGKKDIALAKRVKAANDAGATAYFSMHHNAGLYGKLIGYLKKLAGGTVVFYYSSKEERKRQAEELYKAIVSRTGLVGDRAQPVVKKGFYVLKNTKMPAFLVENGFMDSPTDVPVILSEEHARKTAEGLVSFIVKEFDLKKRKDPVTSQNTATAAYYPAYTGAKATLSVALASLGITNTYNFRKLIAAKNGIAGYCGTYAQNVQMYNLLVAGMLKRV